MLGMTSVPLRSESGMQRRDQADRPALDWFHFGECCVDEKYSARLYTKLEQLLIKVSL